MYVYIYILLVIILSVLVFNGKPTYVSGLAQSVDLWSFQQVSTGVVSPGCS